MRSFKPLRPVLALLGALCLFLLGGYVQYAIGLPFGTVFDSEPGQTVGGRTDVPIVSTAQGAQDAARADTPMGAATDLQRCIATMLARKESPAEAREVCTKLIGGITH